MDKSPETARAEGAGPKPTNLTVLPKQKQKLKRALPTGRIGFTKQLDMLRAYGAVSGDDHKPVKNAEVGAIVKLHPDTVSLANAYFVEVGFLERAGNGGFLPAPEVLDYHHANQWNAETAVQKLGPLLRRSWFYQTLESKLSYGPLSENDAMEDLARESNASPDFKSQLSTLIDYLEITGVVAKEGGMLRKLSGKAEEKPRDEAPAVAEERAVAASPKVTSNVSTSFAKSSEAGVVAFNISVKVDMTEFAGWSPERISAFFAGIAQVLAAKSRVEETQN